MNAGSASCRPRRVWTLIVVVVALARGSASERGTASLAQVSIHSGRPGCEVELDGAPAGKTDPHGDLVLLEVEPSDHYIHVRCPNDQERGYFVSPRAGQTAEVRAEPADALAASHTGSSLAAAEGKIELRRLVLRAVQRRGHGQLDDAVHDLREALRLDPGNSDLHRELGITFLLYKDWKRARVEMLEAIRHEPDDADAHNGLGYALEKLGDVKEAIKEYRIATRLEPEDASYRRHYLEAIGKLAAEQSPQKGGGMEVGARSRPHH